MKSIIKMQSIFRGIKIRRKVKSGIKTNSRFDQDNVIKYHNIKSKKIVKIKSNKNIEQGSFRRTIRNL